MRSNTKLQTLVGPTDVAADPLRVCPMAFGFGFADLPTSNDNDTDSRVTWGSHRTSINSDKTHADRCQKGQQGLERGRTGHWPACRPIWLLAGWQRQPMPWKPAPRTPLQRRLPRSGRVMRGPGPLRIRPLRCCRRMPARLQSASPEAVLLVFLVALDSPCRKDAAGL